MKDEIYFIRNKKNGEFLKSAFGKRTWVNIGSASWWKTKEIALRYIITIKAAINCEICTLDLSNAPLKTKDVIDAVTKTQKKNILKKHSPVKIAQWRIENEK